MAGFLLLGIEPAFAVRRQTDHATLSPDESGAMK
jgi:hypothetical protein